MLLPPPTSTLFPYTTLFRSVNYFDPQIGEAAALVLWHNGFDVYVPPGQVSSGLEALAHGDVRSEEHTSELQSRLHLVCRLLLEKKKKTAEATNIHQRLSPMI